MTQRERLESWPRHATCLLLLAFVVMGAMALGGCGRRSCGGCAATACSTGYTPSGCEAPGQCTDVRPPSPYWQGTPRASCISYTPNYPSGWYHAATPDRRGDNRQDHFGTSGNY